MKNCINNPAVPGGLKDIFASVINTYIAMKKQNETEQEKVWICSVCGHRYEGPEPPEKCPVCGVTREYFDEVVQ